MPARELIEALQLGPGTESGQPAVGRSQSRWLGNQDHSGRLTAHCDQSNGPQLSEPDRELRARQTRLDCCAFEGVTW